MAYNNIFPVGYQQANYSPINYSQPQFSQNNQLNQPLGGLIWVQGEAGAKSYLVAPNTTVQLWDSENQIIYLKSADASGMPSMKIIDYTIRGANLPTADASINEGKFISKDELDALNRKIERLEGEINKLKPHKKEEKRNG